MNVFYAIFFSLISFINYAFLFVLATAYLTYYITFESATGIMNWMQIGMPVLSIILSILTGIFFYILFKKRLDKVINIFASLQVILFLYSIYKIVLILGNNSITIYQ